MILGALENSNCNELLFSAFQVASLIPLALEKQ